MPPNGYAWWYIDAISDCGTRAVSVIAFIGSVFSPWYAWAGRRDPENHVCINVVTYGPGGRFCMTDRGRSALRQTAQRFTVGPSRLTWTGTRLEIDINERGAAPQFGRISGKITLRPSGLANVELPLTEDGAHIWRPFAPVSDVTVDLNGTGGRWQGHGYFDANFGTRALEQDFSYWTWSRYPTKDGAVCFYDATRLDGSELAQGVRFDRTGAASPYALPPKAPLPRGLWTVRRETRADAGYRPGQALAMLDAPFYTRSAIRTQLDGMETVGVHEALDLTRFRSPLLKPMLAVRVPRRARWRFDD